MIMQPETGKLSVKEEIGHNPGDGVANFIYQTIMLLQLSFHTNTFGTGAGAIAVLLLPGRLAGAVATR
jgi:Na+/melibiose symporter-like transporter